MENICIVDTETTGLDPANRHVIEIAAIYYNIPSRSIISQASTLLYQTENAAYEINRIEVAALLAVSQIQQDYMVMGMVSMMMMADAVIAHNADFDKKFLNTIPVFQPIVRDKKWICTRNDVTWPIRKGVALNLTHICVDLGVPIVNAHRALSDCRLLLDAIECNEDIETFLDKSGKGKIIYHADINYENRQLAKDHGFLWDNLKKVWWAKLKTEDAEKIPFMIYPALNA